MEERREGGPFQAEFQMLGVTVDLKRVFEHNELLVSNTDKRRGELKDTIEEILRRGILSKAQAAMLVGRLGFASSQTFGRVGTAALRDLRLRAAQQSGNIDIVDPILERSRPASDLNV